MCGAQTSRGVVLLVSDSIGEKRDHELLVKESTSRNQMIIHALDSLVRAYLAIQQHVCITRGLCTSDCMGDNVKCGETNTPESKQLDHWIF